MPFIEFPFTKFNEYVYLEKETEKEIEDKINNEIDSSKDVQEQKCSDKTEIIEDMYLFYHYIMYIDNTLWCKSIDEIIEKMSLTYV